MSNAPGVPPHVVDAMKDQRPVHLDGGVVLRAPTDPDAAGGAGCYRIDWRTPEGKRCQKARRLLEDAWSIAYSAAEHHLDTETITATGVHSRATFRALCEHYLDPSGHPLWGSSREATVRSLVRCWLLADHIVVTKVDKTTDRLADMPVGRLTPKILTEACGYVRTARSWRTYKEVHIIVGALIGWAIQEGFLTDADDVRSKFHLAPNPKPTRTSKAGTSKAGDLPIPMAMIPPHSEMIRFAEALGERFGWRQKALYELMTWAGFRIGEVLALCNDARFRWKEDTQGWEVHVFERVMKSSSGTAPPKWGKERWAWIPGFLTDTVTKLLNETPEGAPLFPAARGGLMAVTRWHEERFTPVAEVIGWPQQENWRPKNQPEVPGKQTSRRWKWPPHTTRHHAASYMLAPRPGGFGLAADDVATYLGHRSGWQVWEMYGHAQPDMAVRAATASLEIGDPRKAASKAPASRLTIVSTDPRLRRSG